MSWCDKAWANDSTYIAVGPKEHIDSGHRSFGDEEQDMLL
jgi:hypothetical protein